MVALPSCFGVSATLVTIRRWMLCAPFENSMVVCSDCERPTRSKSLKSGSCTSAPCDPEATVTRICRLSVPSTATSSASVEAWTWMSSAARAPPATRATSRSAALPILLDIAPPLPVLPRETPYLEILLAGLQGVEESLRLAAIQRFLTVLGPCLGRIAVLGLLRVRLLLLTRRALRLARFRLGFLRLPLIVLLLVLGRLGLVVLLVVSGLRCLILLGLPALLLHLLVVLALLLLVLLLLGFAHRLRHLLLALLLPQEKLEIHLRVRVGRVEGERLRVRVHGALGPARLLARLAELVSGERLERGIALLQRLGRVGERARSGFRIPAAQVHRGPVEGQRAVGGPTLGDLGRFIGLERALQIVLGGQRISRDDVGLRLLPQAAHGAARLHPEAGCDHERAGDRFHVVPRRRSASVPSPSIAAAHSRKKAGQANWADRSAYCTERRDSSSPFWSFSTSGTSCRIPRSPPDPSSSLPPAAVAMSWSMDASARVSTVRPWESFL